MESFTASANAYFSGDSHIDHLPHCFGNWHRSALALRDCNEFHSLGMQLLKMGPMTDTLHLLLFVGGFNTLKCKFLLFINIKYYMTYKCMLYTSHTSQISGLVFFNFNDKMYDYIFNS